jgi:hypothetical protein
MKYTRRRLNDFKSPRLAVPAAAPAAGRARGRAARGRRLAHLAPGGKVAQAFGVHLHPVYFLSDSIY